jgi:Fuc2NAc and GlcNAc transferase
MLHAIVLLVIAATASYLGVVGLRRWALHRLPLDIPNQRSSHFRPTPRGGGLAIVLVTVLGWIALEVFFRQSTSRAALFTYSCAVGAIAAVSWLDDLYGLSAKLRLVIHALAALAAIFSLGYWQSLPLLPGWNAPLGYAGAAITLVWIVGLTNAYNFMDGSDGMAGLQAVIAGLGWACVGWLAGSPSIVGLSLLLAAGSLGFLLHNWPPARIFMGDVGSAFLGYSFAALAILGTHTDGPLASASPVIGPLLVWPFVFDAGFTFLRRLRNGEDVLAAHRSHLYQRLIIAGHSHRFVMLLYGALAIVGAVAAVFWLTQPVAAYCCSAVLFPSLAWLLCRYVAGEELRAWEAAKKAQLEPEQVPLRRAA